MPRFIFLLLMSFFSLICSADINEIVGVNIQQAREEIVKKGWLPRETYLKNEEGFEHDYVSSAEFFKGGFPEVEICAGTGVNPCIFNYIKGNKCLRVYTEGEHIESTVVTFVSQECPPTK